MAAPKLAHELPSVERLRELFSYDPETGAFTYRSRKGKRRAGDPAGTFRPDGYLQLRVDYVKLLGHRVAWAMTFGEWPQDGMWLDHRDCNPSNNAISNLRLATPTQNLANSRIRSDNTSGIKGVARRHDGIGWSAHISRAGRCYCLGSYATAEEAAAAYRAAVREAHGEFSRFS